jgi:N-acetylmuramoyl-L-alanine amidase
MYNFGKVGFDPGHYAGANAGPGTYREGDVMLQLGLMLQKAYGCFLTRANGNDLVLLKRAKLAKEAGCNTLISLHTNAPEAAKGIIVFYSLAHPADRAIAEYIGQEISKAEGIPFRAAKTRPSDTRSDRDYYGMIRYPVDLGIEHPFIVEHGSHWEMAVNTQDKLLKITECYGRILGVKKEMTVSEAIDIWVGVGAGVVLDPAGMKKDFETGSFRPDRMKAFVIKSAQYIRKG